MSGSRDVAEGDVRDVTRCEEQGDERHVESELKIVEDRREKGDCYRSWAVFSQGLRRWHECLSVLRGKGEHNDRSALFILFRKLVTACPSYSRC